MSRSPNPFRRRALASVLAGALVASAAAVGVAAPAAAAEGDVAAATLDWGVKQSFRSYLASPIAHGTTTTGGGTTVNGDGSFHWVDGSGSFAAATPTADVSFGGDVHFSGHEGALDMLLENPRVEISGSTGTLYLDVVSKALSGGSFDQDDVAFATLSLGAPSVADEVASWSGVAATLTDAGASAFGGFYTAGTALDALSFSLPYEGAAAPEPVATTTSIAATPAGTAEEGAEVSFTATVAPAADGTVQFSTPDGALGAPVAVSGGLATLATTTLGLGDHAVTATFTPADGAAYLGSVSDSLAYAITPKPDPDAAETATTLAVSEPRVKVHDELSLTATVANADAEGAVPAGSVEFFDIAAGTTDRVSLGSVALESGSATLKTTALAAGGHAFVAVYVPGTGAFLASESAASSNVGVVETTLPLTCNLSPTDAVTGDTAATAAWNWSAYSSGWTKVAGGNATVDGQTFALTDGVVKADDDCAQISFTGTLRTEAYSGFFPPNGQWVELVDPTLTVSSDGSGAWSAGVRTGIGAYDASAAAPRLTVAIFSGQTVGGPGATGAREISFAYENTTAPGTWSVSGGTAWANAWPNEFILAAPSAIQAFYYQSGTSAANATKPASALSIDFAWPAVTSLSAAVAPIQRTTLGEDITLSATVSPSNVPGTVEFFETPAGGTEASLGSVAVSGGTGELVTDALAAGGHALRAVFTPSNDFAGSSFQIASNYGIVDDQAPALCTVPEGAEVLTGVGARWGVSAYSSSWGRVAGGDVTVDGTDFVLSNGTARVGDDCTVIDFTGTLRTEAYASVVPPNGQWIELVDPSLVLDADGNGAWIAGVRAGAGEYSASEAPRVVVTTVTGQSLDFSGDSVDASVALDYAGTVAPGTWSAAADVYTNAWGNQFILALPQAQRAWFYQTSATGANLTKPPAPLAVEWSAVAAAVTVTGPAGSITPGSTLTFAGSGFRLGEELTATVFSEPVVAGTAVADASGSVSISWTVPADFPVGDHRVELSGERTGTAAAGFTVVASAIPGGQVPVAQPEKQCVARSVDGATLDWGVKQSFRSYVTGPIAGGAIETSGASATGDGFRWTGGEGAYNTDASRGRVAYSGSVHFTGHGGQLDLTIANPRVQVNGGSATLIADLRSKGMNGAAGVDASGVAIASLGLPEASVSADRISWSGASATLTAAGAEAFGGFYQAGEALDAVSFSFPLGAEVPCDTTTDGALASTGTDLSVVWIALGMLVLGCAALAMISRRRRTETGAAQG